MDNGNASELKIEYLPIENLKPYNKNARKHSDKDINAIANSIKEFGFSDPIGIWGNENIIVEGHGRLLAAKRLGMMAVPVIRLDHLTDEQRKAYALAHNKTAELSSWFDELLRTELTDIENIDMELFGFDVSSLNDEDKEVPADVPFAEVLDEENNYIVLKFDNTVDWLQLETVFDLPKVKNYSTRKDGKVAKGFNRMGIGRVVNGVEFLNKLGVGI